MKKRLRKKLRLREFQEMGFTIDFDVRLADDESEGENNQEYLEYNSLSDGLNALLHSLGLKVDFGYCTSFVKAAPCTSVTEAQRKTIIDWMQKQPEVAWLRFGQLVDYNWAKKGRT
jgi:uncharacterized protein YggL (DUF469 family)